MSYELTVSQNQIWPVNKGQYFRATQYTLINNISELTSIIYRFLLHRYFYKQISIILEFYVKQD